MEKLWKRYLNMLDQDINTKIFDNFKNMVLCALLFAAGASALREDRHLFMSFMASSVAGWSLIIICGALMLLNMSDGIRRLSKLQYHLAWQSLIIIIYVIVSERVVELVWTFRSE